MEVFVIGIVASMAMSSFFKILSKQYCLGFLWPWVIEGRAFGGPAYNIELE